METLSVRQFGGEKMFLHADRLAVWQSGCLPLPVTVELDVTNLCNHSCPGCSFSYLVNVRKDSIPLERSREIVDELGTLGVKALTFSGGGEPLVYGQENVLALMRQARRHHMDVALITNGSLLRSEEFLNLCTWVRISLDGYDAETFARFHGRCEGEFQKVCENLRTICKAKTRLKSDCTVGVGFLTDSESLVREDFEKMARFCSGFAGLDYVQFRPLVVNMVADPTLQGGGALLSGTELRLINESFLAARHSYSRSDFRVLISGGKYSALAESNAGRTYHRCHAHFLEATIGADAKVYICCHGQGQDSMCLGDISQQSFAEVWHSDRARQIYEATDPSVMCPPACRLHLQNKVLEEMTMTVHPNFI